MKNILIGSIGTVSLLALASTAQAAGFVNGGFENGDASGWTQGGGSRAFIPNPLTPSTYFPGDGGVRSSVVNTSYVDPNLGASLGSTVYSGNYSFRVEDTTNGGYTSVIKQTVNNYTDANIFFAWKAVLQNGGHAEVDSATMIITLRDLTTGTDLIRREYNAGAGGGGVDPRFSTSGNFFYTADWQIEQLAIDKKLTGHDFELSVLAADCDPTGHTGYVYLDGFGAVTPPPIDPGAVPEPASWAMMISGFGLVGGAMRARRRKGDTTVSFA